MTRLLQALVLALALASTACQRQTDCHVTIGDARCDINPYSNRLANVGGYEYFTGGHRGIVVIRTGLTDFVAFERTCPCDDNSRVEMSPSWDGQLECPTCHSCFDPLGHGQPFSDAATPCPLYEYTARYDGGVVHIY